MKACPDSATNVPACVVLPAVDHQWLRAQPPWPKIFTVSATARPWPKKCLRDSEASAHRTWDMTVWPMGMSYACLVACLVACGLSPTANIIQSKVNMQIYKIYTTT